MNGDDFNFNVIVGFSKFCNPVSLEIFIGQNGWTDRQTAELLAQAHALMKEVPSMHSRSILLIMLVFRVW